MPAMIALRWLYGSGDQVQRLNFVQWWLPVTYNEGVPETVYRKEQPVGLHFVFSIMEDPTNGFGRFMHSSRV